MTGMMMAETTTAATLQAQVEAVIIPAAGRMATIPVQALLMAEAQALDPMTMTAPAAVTTMAEASRLS